MKKKDMKQLEQIEIQVSNLIKENQDNLANLRKVKTEAQNQLAKAKDAVNIAIVQNDENEFAKAKEAVRGWEISVEFAELKLGAAAEQELLPEAEAKELRNKVKEILLAEKKAAEERIQELYDEEQIVTAEYEEVRDRAAKLATRIDRAIMRKDTSSPGDLFTAKLEKPNRSLSEHRKTVQKIKDAKENGGE